MAKPRENKPVQHTKKHIARLERERRQTRMILGGFIAIIIFAVGMLVYGYVDQHYLAGAASCGTRQRRLHTRRRVAGPRAHAAPAAD